MNGAFLVTGGTGFLGNNLIRFLLEKYPDKKIVNYSRHTYAVNPLTHKDLWDKPQYVSVAGDLNDVLLLHETIQKHDVETVFHLAASTHVDRAFTYPTEFLESNLYGTYCLLEVLRKIESKPLMICMSTDEVFGDVAEGFCREDEILKPRNPYSASKAAAEMFCNAWHHSYGINVIIARSMNMFGPYQHPEKLIGKIITRSLTDTHFSLYEGGSIRGWVYVNDTCEALDILKQKGKIGSIYHIPPDTYLTVPEVAESILKITGKEQLFDGYKGRRLQNDERYALDGNKFTYELKWRPPTEFQEGLKKTISWFDSNRWFWEHVYSP